MNTTTYRWLLESHIQQTRAYLQRLETELEKHDAAEARDTEAAPAVKIARAVAEARPDLMQRLAEAEYKLGDPDPTPELDDDQEYCDAEHRLGYLCTWPEGHTGVHVAGDGEKILAIWPRTPPVPVEDLRADCTCDPTWDGGHGYTGPCCLRQPGSFSRGFRYAYSKER